jgi:hypothetical protein
MWVTPEQLHALIRQIRIEYGPTPDLVRIPEVVAHLLRQEYGIDGVYDPPPFNTIVAEYTPEYWRQRTRGPTISSGTWRDRFSRPPTYAEQVMADLNLLTSNPIAALVYVICRAAGVESGQAIEFGRFVGLVTVALTATTRHGRVSASRALSGSSGRPRDAHISEAERRALVYQIGSGRLESSTAPGPPPAPLRPLPPLPRSSPERIRERLERMERMHGRSTAPIR